MLRDITLGQYYAVDSPIHKLDPRVKIIAAIMYIIELFLVKTFVGFAICFGALAIVVAVAKVPVRYILRGLKPVLLILFFIIVYISNRYSCQKSLIEIDQLNTELQDAKYRALSSASELTERCRESNVLEMLRIQKDSTLKIPSEPPYIVEIKN